MNYSSNYRESSSSISTWLLLCEDTMSAAEKLQLGLPVYTLMVCLEDLLQPDIES